MDAGTVIVLAALAAVATLVVWLHRRGLAARDENKARIEALDQQAAAISGQQQEFIGRLSQFAEQTTRERAELTRTLQERLDGVSKRMSDSLSESSEKTANSLGNLGKHLQVIDKAQQNITELTGQVIGLQDILDNKQARGAFGEVQLNDLVSAILPPSAYVFQATLANSRRVDCLIHLPNPPGPICVDSKFPLESYHQLRNAEDETALVRAKRDFRTAIAKHVQDIAERYIIPGETAESALMFLPSEAVYAELHTNFLDAVEQSYRARVWIVSPTTLMATLNTVRAVLKDVRMREQAGVIQIEVQKMLEDVERLDKRVGNLGRHFKQMDDDIKEIAISTDKIIRRAEEIDEVQMEQADPGEAIEDVGDVARLGTSGSS